MGFGSIGKRHAQILDRKGCKVAVADPYCGDAAQFPVFTSLDKGLEFSPDMVWICSPTEFHYEQAIKVIKARTHLFIEKPVAHDVEAAEKLLKLHRDIESKKLVWVGCNMRFHPAVMQLKSMLEDDIIGKILILRFHFSHWLPNMRPGTDYRKTYAAGKEGGGIMLDDIHDIDLALWFGGPAVKISGLTARSSMLDMASENIANINICHEDEIFSNIHMDFLRKDKSRGIQVIGETGSLEWQSSGKNPENAEIKFFSMKGDAVETVWAEQIIDFNAMFEKQYDEISVAIDHSGKYNHSLIQAIDALKVVSKVKNYDR